MANNNISFDTNDVSSIVSYLNNDVQALSAISTSISSSFNQLTSCDLFVEGISKLTQKVDSIKTSYESIITAIGGQINNYADVETAVQNAADNYMSYYSNDRRSSGGGGKDYGYGLESVDTVEKGEQIGTTLDDEVKSIDDKTLVDFLNFVNVNKGETVSINDIFKDENSKVLALYLQAYYKQYENKELTINDETLIRSELINSILNSEVDLPKTIKDESIIMYKEYLSAIAKANNVSLGDYFTKSEYKESVKTTLLNLYNGKVDAKQYGLDENYAEQFKNLVDKKAKSLNLSVDEVLSNPLCLL